MTATTVKSITTQLFIGLKVRLTGEQLPISAATDALQEYVNRVGLCVSVTPTEYSYVGGSESGLTVTLINYPRFPSTRERIKEHTIAIAELLLVKCRQCRVTAVIGDETIMLSNEQAIAEAE